MQRARDLVLELHSLSIGEQTAVLGEQWQLECQKVASLEDFASVSGDVAAYLAALERIGVVVHENPD